MSPKKHARQNRLPARQRRVLEQRKVSPSLHARPWKKGGRPARVSVSPPQSSGWLHDPVCLGQPSDSTIYQRSRGKGGVVSVIMAAWKSHRWLPAAAESVLDQRLPQGWSLELLIGVDDCDSTLRAALALTDPRVVVVRMSENVGPYRTLNTLLDHTQGSLVAVMDSDDRSTSRRLATQVWALTSTSKYDVVAGFYQNCDERLKPSSPPTKKLCHGAMMARRSLYDRLGGYQPWRCGADVDFFIRAQKVGARTALVDSTLLLRRVHASSLSHSSSTGMRSALRARVMMMREQEMRREAATVVRRMAEPHEVVRDERDS